MIAFLPVRQTISQTNIVERADEKLSLKGKEIHSIGHPVRGRKLYHRFKTIAKDNAVIPPINQSINQSSEENAADRQRRHARLRTSLESYEET